MNGVMHSRRIASFITNKAGGSAGIQRQLELRHQPARQISTTQYLAAVVDDEGPRTAQKKTMKEKKGPSASKMQAQENQANKMYDLMVKAFDTPHREPPPASEEEMARRHQVGRNYVIGSFKRHNDQNHDLACKIRMKNHALKMLPKEGGAGDEIVNGKSVYGKWKSEALKLNDSWGPPPGRHIPMFTPPIEDFNIDLYMNQDDEED